jgi:Flp pilus assembly pilin Flp
VHGREGERAEETMRLIERIREWLEQQRGQTLVEYAMVILLVAIASVAALGTFSGSINAFYSSVTAMLP